MEGWGEGCILSGGTWPMLASAFWLNVPGPLEGVHESSSKTLLSGREGLSQKSAVIVVIASDSRILHIERWVNQRAY